MDFEEEDQQFTFFGTELDPIKEDDVVRKKPLRIEDEVATDEQGRRRFHGAFTGGFSAGYFNTVGSKEGWAPSTFKSSRDKRGDGGVRRPEDYMDDEDRGIFGIAPQVLRPTEDFRDKATKKRRPLDSTGTIPGVPVLHDLLRPVKETIGVRLLRVMGWRPGQGVGERITQREKKARAKKMANTKVYGCLLPPELAPRSNQDEIGESEEESEDDIELDAQILYAPDDIPPFLVKPKENSFGLGYVGLVPELAKKNEKKKLLFEPTLSITDKNKRLRIAGQAFGVGAFENEDEDIYAKDDMSRYDFVLGGPPEKKRKEMPALTYDSPYVEGFEPAKERPPVFKVYPPPSLPPNFAPFHKASKSRWDIPPELYYPLREIQSQKPSSSKLTATDRGALLKTQAELKAVAIAKAAQAPPEPPKLIEKVHDAETLAKIETLNKEIQDNLRRDPERFKPFTKDPPKQERYEAYMVLTRLGKKDEFGLLQPLNMTEWEKSREINEFDRASMLFKPMKGAIGNRFVSGGQVEENVPGGLGVFDPTVHQVKEMFPKRMEPGDERKNAACMKLYGKMTREISEWHPDRMLCIRFNVPNPFPELADIKRRPNRPVKRDKYSIFDFLSVDSPDNLNMNSKPSLQAIEPPKTVAAEDLPSQPFAATQQNGSQSEIQPQNVEQSATAQSITTQETSEDEGMDQQEEKEQRPPMDLFKAIFEDESEDEKGEPTKVESARDTSSKPSPKPTPATQSKPNIFANLDQINPPAPSREKTPVIDDVPTDAYGPKVPSKLNTASTNPVLASSSGVASSRDRKNEPEEEEWVEATSKSRNKKSKKEKYKKSKKKKSKSHKKSKRKSNSDSSSEDSDSDLDAVLSRKLKKLKKNM